MIFKFRLENIGAMKATMTISMTVSQWQELRKQLHNKYPASVFSNAITDIVDHASKQYREIIDDE